MKNTFTQSQNSNLHAQAPMRDEVKIKEKKATKQLKCQGLSQMGDIEMEKCENQLKKIR